MRSTTVEMIKIIRQLYLDMAFGHAFEDVLKEDVCKEIDQDHVKNVGIDLEGYGPIRAGYVEAFFSDPMAIDAVRTILAVSISMRSKLDTIVAQHLVQQLAISAIGNSTPKGDA